MLRVAARRIAQRPILAAGGAVAIGGGVSFGTYLNTEEGLGFRREYQFWKKVFPVVLDYVWKTSSSSPYVRYQNMIEEDLDEETRKEKRRLLVSELHEKHAPEILDVMLELKGLYVKLGQVLSVTALPVPEAYRERFRTLQSDVTGWEHFEEVVKPVVEAELGRPIDEIFSHFDPVPCGAASIGQAHRATLRPDAKSDDNNSTSKKGKEVVVKVQYPNATWEVPADIHCVGQFLSICVFFGVAEKESSRLAFDEFARQFLAELDYDQERQNLEEIYKSSCHPDAPYRKRGVVVPEVYKDLCTNKIITMSYLPGPKLEEEAKRQLQLLGIDTSKGLRGIVGKASREVMESNGEDSTQTGEKDNNKQELNIAKTTSWHMQVSRVLGNVLGLDSILWAVRLARGMMLWSTSVLATGIRTASSFGAQLPTDWESWAEANGNAAKQAERLALTAEWLDALFDVHGHQVFHLGLFNADPHPGNILVIDEDEANRCSNDYESENHNSNLRRGNQNKLGLIDYGQCKRLNQEEQEKIAKLILCVANEEADPSIAAAFRDLGIKTQNDSTEFLANFARLMFGPFRPEYLDHSWHKNFHETDRLLYFPKELSLVYRTSMLLRGLALSLQFNISISEKWRDHAQAVIDRRETMALTQPYTHKNQNMLVTNSSSLYTVSVEDKCRL